MTKQEYLNELEETLKQLPVKEREAILDYFKEYMEETNLEMPQIVEELGSPKELAEELVAGMPQKELPPSLPQDFAVLGLNGLDCDSKNFFTKAFYRSLIAAYVLEAFAQTEQNRLTAKQISEFHSGKFLAEEIVREEKPYLLGEWLREIKKIKTDKVVAMNRAFIREAKKSGKIEEVTGLLEYDLYYEDQAFDFREFRVEKILYQKTLYSFKKDWLESKTPNNRSITLFWLLEQNGLLSRIFNKEEQMCCEEQKVRAYTRSGFAKLLWQNKLLSSIVQTAKEAMSVKNGFFRTAIGVGLAYCFPVLAKREAVFIGGENWISTSENAADEVIQKLKKRGHLCLLRRKGKVPLIEIDNVMYEMLPSVRTFRFSSVFGFQLRRYVL